jgi:hypothetical protein
MQPQTALALREGLACLTATGSGTTDPSNAGSFGGGDLSPGDITITSLRDLTSSTSQEMNIPADSEANTAMPPAGSSCSSRLRELQSLLEGDESRSRNLQATGLLALTTVELKVAIRPQPSLSASPAAVINTRLLQQTGASPSPAGGSGSGSTSNNKNSTMIAMKNLISFFSGQLNITAVPWEQLALLSGTERQALSVIYRFSSQLHGSLLPGKFTKDAATPTPPATAAARLLQTTPPPPSNPFDVLDYSKMRTALETTPSTSSSLPPSFNGFKSAVGNNPAVFTVSTIAVEVDGTTAGTIDPSTAANTGAAIISAVTTADEKQAAANAVPSNPPGPVGPGNNDNGAVNGASAAAVNNALIIGLIIALLLALCIGAAFFMYWRSKKAKRVGGVAGSSDGAKRRRSTNTPRRGSVALTTLNGASSFQPYHHDSSTAVPNPMVAALPDDSGGGSTVTVIGGNGATINNLRSPQVVFNPLMVGAGSPGAITNSQGHMHGAGRQSTVTAINTANPLLHAHGMPSGGKPAPGNVKTILFDEDGGNSSKGPGSQFSPDASSPVSPRSSTLHTGRSKKNFGLMTSGRDMFSSAGDGGAQDEMGGDGGGPTSFAARALSNKSASRKALQLDDDDNGARRMQTPGSAGDDDAGRAGAFGPVRTNGGLRSTSAGGGLRSTSSIGSSGSTNEDPTGHDDDNGGTSMVVPNRRRPSSDDAPKMSFRTASSRRKLALGSGASSRSIGGLASSSVVTPVDGAAVDGKNFSSLAGVASQVSNTKKSVSKLMAKASSRGLLSLSAGTSSVLSPLPPASLPTPPAPTQQQRMDALRGFASNRMVLGGSSSAGASLGSFRPLPSPPSAPSAPAAMAVAAKEDEGW